MIYKDYIKSVFDRVLALVLIIALSPVWLLGLAIVFFFQGTPLFFVQQRSGQNLKIFRIIKVRTLAISDSTDLSLSNRAYSRIGKFLRKFGLDEIPQLLNILKGEMSFIGPRPLPAEYETRYDEFQKYRFQCKPGITGWAQINGRNSITWDAKFEYDNWYIDNISFSLDLKIVLLTFFNLFRSEKTDEMPVFTGSNVN